MLNKFNLLVIRVKLRETLEFVKLLRVEPYLLLIAFQIAFKGTANSQMVEDKICGHWFDTTDQYCHDLPSNDDEGDCPMHFKSKVLANAAKFVSYNAYITTAPTLIWALFAGNWIDRYGPARKLLMYLAVCATIIEDLIAIFLSIQWKTSIYYNLLLHVPSSILGGNGAGIAIQHYMTTTTPSKLMAIRFLIFELCWTIAVPIGAALGGFILVQKPLFHSHGEIRNYATIYIVALAFEMIALFWIIFMIDEKVARKQVLKNQLKEGITTKDREESQIKSKSGISTEVKNINPLRLLFDLENVKSMFRMMFKKRPNKARAQIILLNMCMVVYLIERFGGGALWSQYVQRVYLWPPDWTAYIGAIGNGMQSLTTIILVPVLINVFKIRDVNLSIIGFVAMFMVVMIKDSWYSPLACYISMPINTITGLAGIACKSLMTKVIDKNEIGKIMSFRAVIDTLIPIFISTFMVYIFESPIDTYPGTVYQLIATLSMIPIFILIWIDLFTDPINYDDQDVGTSKQDKRNFNLNIENNNENDIHNKIVLIKYVENID